MTFAVISDIHGNLPALEAVLEDAAQRGVTGYIIAGDYCLSGPYPDGCITALRSIPDKYIIRGNEEKYLEDLIGKDRSTWTDGQMQISYWCSRNISPDNMDWLMSLPHTLEIQANGVNISVAHASKPFIGDTEFELFGPAVIARRYPSDVSADKLSRDIHSLLDSDEDFQQALDELTDGVYIFGHSHVQWSYRKGGVLLLNPGSCGLPLDGIKDSIPYSLLTIGDDGEVHTEELRLPFDKKRYVSALKATSQFTQANVWSNVIIKELLTAKEHLTFFLQFADKYAREIGDDRRPFVVDTWEKAYEIWSMEHKMNKAD